MALVDEIYRKNSARKYKLDGRRTRNTISLEGTIKNINKKRKKGFIIEFKRSSPSGFRGNTVLNPEDFAVMVHEYADAISVLTEPDHFNGSLQDGTRLQGMNMPMLMKDFICTEDMILAGYHSGFDAVLLIADFLSGNDMDVLVNYALSLKMDVLAEFHDTKALERIPEKAGILVGYNRRNLKSLKMEPNEINAMSMISERKALKILESGIGRDNFQELLETPYNGFLIGTSVLNEPKFLKEIKEGESNYVDRKHA